MHRLWPVAERKGPLGLAVSGGPDSFALLALAHAAIPGEVAVASINHGLRPEAASEVASVQSVCERLAIPFSALSVEVPPGNIQAMARKARYAALADWASNQSVSAIATAHHANDQAETLLMRLTRGSGLAGLAGVRDRTRVPDTDIPLIRPLLDWTKSELSEVVDQSGITPVSDPSNADQQFERVRVRQHLAEHDWLDPVQLATSADNLSDAWRAIEWYAERDWAERVRPDGAGFDYEMGVPRAIAIETIVRIVGELGAVVTRGEAARAYDRLQNGENASLGGVLAVTSSGAGNPAGADGPTWRFAKEPPRLTR